MGFSRADLDAGRVDLSDLRAEAEPVRLSSPGVVLRRDFLEPLGISAYCLAKDWACR
ncbi:MAG TPA: hypothetical protein VGE72_16245 [Azospirillum sp.]